MNQFQQIQMQPNSVAVMCILTPINAGKDSAVQIVPIQNVPDLWTGLAYLMEAVGTTAASMTRDNPVAATDHEDMAQYVSQYITKVIMTANPRKG